MKKFVFDIDSADGKHVITRSFNDEYDYFRSLEYFSAIYNLSLLYQHVSSDRTFFCSFFKIIAEK
jgi:hypothetical protein